MSHNDGAHSPALRLLFCRLTGVLLEWTTRCSYDSADLQAKVRGLWHVQYTSKKFVEFLRSGVSLSIKLFRG